jgi:hypothetical protein
LIETTFLKEMSEEAGGQDAKGFSFGPENIWAAGQYALRDLFLFLIQKYSLDDVSNPKARYFE